MHESRVLHVRGLLLYVRGRTYCADGINAVALISINNFGEGNSRTPTVVRLGPVRKAIIQVRQNRQHSISTQ